MYVIYNMEYDTRWYMQGDFSSTNMLSKAHQFSNKQEAINAMWDHNFNFVRHIDECTPDLT